MSAEEIESKTEKKRRQRRRKKSKNAGNATTAPNVNGASETTANNTEGKKKKKRRRQKRKKSIEDGTTAPNVNGASETTANNTESTKKKKRSRQRRKSKSAEDGSTEPSADGAGETTANNTETAAQTGRRKRRGKLERCFGFFRCRACKTQWTSAFTWRIRDTPKVVFRQQCQRCREFWFPWKNDYLTCSQCGKKTPDCECPRRRKRKDSQKPHRSDLCEKCLSGRPCQTTGANEDYVPEE